MLIYRPFFHVILQHAAFVQISFRSPQSWEVSLFLSLGRSHSLMTKEIFSFSKDLLCHIIIYTSLNLRCSTVCINQYCIIQQKLVLLTGREHNPPFECDISLCLGLLHLKWSVPNATSIFRGVTCCASSTGDKQNSQDALG